MKAFWTNPCENWGIAFKTIMTIPQFFKEKNYTSISVGKIFHNTAAASGPGDTSTNSLDII